MILTGILLLGCSTKGTIEIQNNTANKIFFTFLDNSYTLTKGQSKIFEVDTGKEYIFHESSKTYPLQLVGETFLMLGGAKETEVTVKGNQKLHLYTYPTHACIKVKNLGPTPITSLKYIQHFLNKDEESPNLIVQPIAQNESQYFRLAYSEPTGTTSFTYSFEIGKSEGPALVVDRVFLPLDSLYTVEME